MTSIPIWYNINEEEIKSDTDKDLFKFKYLEDSDNVYQFRILDPTGNILSVSDKFVINPNTSFPVMISSNPFNFDNLDLDEKSIKITLKYNDNLTLKDTTQNSYITMNLFVPSDQHYLDIPYSCTNLDYENHTETVLINNNSYTWNYCLVTFYCNFSHCNLSNTNYDMYAVTYKFTLENIIGVHFKENPCNFYYFINSYKDTSLNPKKKLTIKEHENQLKVDESVNLNVDILSDEISKDNLIWVSSDENIAKVDENGVVTAAGVGTAYIYATEDNTNELYDYCVVNVTGPVSKISLDVSTLALSVGKSYKLLPTIEPETALDKTITWASSDEKIATVDENGLVTAKKTGTVVITATSNYDTAISSTCHIIVTNPKVDFINITGLPNTIKVGSSFKLSTTIYPSNATNKQVTWKSSNTKYATVNSKGIVNIKSAGAGKVVRITATAKDGSDVSQTVIIRIPTIKVSKLKLKASKTTVVAGKSVKITASVNPSNAANKKVTWKSSNTKYATVNSKGVVVTKKAGRGKNVKITAISKDNSKVKATITIKIK